MLAISMVITCTACSMKKSNEKKTKAASDTGFDGTFDASVNPGNVQEVVYVNGSWTEMGRQYGLQQKTQLENSWTTIMTLMLEEESKEDIKKSMESILSHLKKDDSAAYEFISGVADGAGISEADAVITVLGSSVLNSDDLMKYTNKKDRGNKCMTVSAWEDMTKNGHHLGAANLDAESTTTVSLFSHMVSYPKDGYAVVASGGIQGNAFMNSEGLIITFSSGPEVAPEDGDKVLKRTGTYFNSLFSLWYTATKCANADDAVAMLTQGDWAVLGNLNISDNKGNAYIMEQSDYAVVSRKSGDYGETNYLLSANQFLDKSWKNKNYKEGEDDKPRYSTVEKILQDNAGKVTPETLANGLGSIRYYENGQWSEENWSYGNDVEFKSPEGCDGYFKTILRTVFDATDHTAYILRGQDEKFRSDVPYGTANYIKLVLGKDMCTTNMSAEDDARLAIRSAGAELYKLNKTNSSAVEKYDKASEALYTGANYTHMAEYAEASGNNEQAVIYYGLATSQYTIAQRFAQASYTTENVIFRN